MNARFYIISFFLLPVFAYAQTLEDVEQVEMTHKECIRIKSDSVACARNYYFQTDSLLRLIYDKVKGELQPSEKSEFMKDQVSWVGRKDAFFKKQDINFAFNVREGTWKKDMIRVPYEEKAEFLMKRLKSLLKRFIQ